MIDRRGFLQLGTALGASALLGASLWSDAVAGELATGGPSPYGPLLPPDENGLMLPAGFQSRVLARAFEPVPGTELTWHIYPDGGAVFPANGGWIYVSNAEDPFFGTGVNALRFDRWGEVVDAYNICTGTTTNCAGGATPWGTWLTCEEVSFGLVHECDPLGRRPQIARPALGRFAHEAVACDPRDRRLYLTEDVSDSALYRFTPHRWRDLSAGVLEVAELREDGRVRWHIVPEPDFQQGDGTPTRYQVPESTEFRGGEGIVFSRGHIYFATKGDDRIWDYHPMEQRLCVLYDRALDPAMQLQGVDNITASRRGDLVVSEDHGGGDQELIQISRDGVVAPILRMVGQNTSELTGPAFDLWERRLYFSSQRGGDRLAGITYEISGPFRLRGVSE